MVSFKLRNEAISNFRHHEEVVLWLEHDLYDQLQLLQILDWFGSQDLASTRLTLICMDRYLGQLQPEELAALFPSRHRVRPAEFETAQEAWAAFRSSDPCSLQTSIGFASSNLPFLDPALERFLEEHPSPADGLSRTERQTLRVIHSGATESAEIFAANQRLETAVFLGDWSFRQYLRRLAVAEHPLLYRWFGGVHLCLPPS